MDNQAVTRRMQRSCTECARRKIKCDHEYPCGTCKRRGQANACRPPDVSLQSTTLSFQMDQDKLALQHRIAMLEAQLGEIHPSQSNDAESENPEGLLVMLESLSHGQPPSPTSLSGRSAITPLYQPGRPVFLMLIPEKNSSHQIIDFALANLTWIHCAVRTPQFLQEHLLFWDKLETGNGQGFQNDHGWLSIYFSLLAVGLFYMDPEERPALPRLNGVEDQGTRPNGDSERGVDVARMWYEAAIRELEASSPLTQPSIQSVQTVAILTLAHSHFGQMEQEYLLLGMAINTARCLDMHLLGSEARFSKRLALKELWSTPESRQLGRRLWWTLVICDWLGMFTRPSSISPSSFNSALEPMDGDNDDLLLNTNASGGVETTDRSVIRHHAAMSQLASVIYVHIKAPRDLKASRLGTVLDKVEAIGESMINREILLSNDVSTWVTAQEYLMQHTINLLSVTMARASLVLWMTDRPGTEDVIERGLNSALKIIHMRQQPVPRVYQCHWIISAATLAAGVFLTIHLLCFKKDAVSTTITERRRLIRYCIDALQYPNPQTPLAIQGSQMLEILLQIEMHSLSCDPTNKGALLNRLRMAFQDEGYPFCPGDGYQSMAINDMETPSHEMGLLWPSMVDGLDIDTTCMDDILAGMDWI